MAITRRQKEVLDFLSTFTSRNGYSPSYEEIAAGLGLSSLATVHKHVTNLQTKGLLQRAHNRSRSIDVIPQRPPRKIMDRLPLLGRIAAGKPVEAIETAETISLGDIIGNREVYALEVQGDSMRDEHIVSGDYVLVERTRTAREGEIVVALVDGTDATLKRFYREGALIRLQPSNTRDEAHLRPRQKRQHPGQSPGHAAQIRLNSPKRPLFDTLVLPDRAHYAWSGNVRCGQ